MFFSLKNGNHAELKFGVPRAFPGQSQSVPRALQEEKRRPKAGVSLVYRNLYFEPLHQGVEGFGEGIEFLGGCGDLLRRLRLLIDRLGHLSNLFCRGPLLL